MMAIEFRAEIVKVLPRADIWFLDETYAPISRRSLASATRYAHRQIAGAGIVKWQTYWDCDDWAIGVWHALKLMHAKMRYLNKAPNEDQSPAAALIEYDWDRGGRHMAVLAYEKGVMFWEPQPPSPGFFKLSEQERWSSVRVLC